jgi:uncharacterized membrane protein YeaQ/YmgE (transglycosylase-associated protein family)
VRLLRFLLRLVGWLLTPLVAWAASLFGAWLGALAAALVASATAAIVLTVIGGAIGAVLGTMLWMRMLRRSPELRHALHVTAEGIPLDAIEEEERSAVE